MSGEKKFRDFFSPDLVARCGSGTTTKEDSKFLSDEFTKLSKAFWRKRNGVSDDDSVDDNIDDDDIDELLSIQDEEKHDGETEQEWHKRRHQQLRSQVSELIDEFELMREQLDQVRCDLNKLRKKTAQGGL